MSDTLNVPTTDLGGHASHLDANSPHSVSGAPAGQPQPSQASAGVSETRGTASAERTTVLNGSDSVMVDLRDVARRQRMDAVKLRQHTDAAVTASWRGVAMMMQMLALAVVACATLGATGYFLFLAATCTLEGSRRSVSTAVAMPAFMAFWEVFTICKYCILRARGRELTMLHVTEALVGIFQAFSLTVLLAVIFLIYAAVLTSPLHILRDNETSADTRVAWTLLVIVSFLAVAIPIEISLFLKLRKMQHALVLSSQTAPNLAKGAADPAGSGGESGHLGVPPGQTASEATALWRGRPLASRMAVFALLACAQAGLAVPLFRGSEVFPAILLATTAVPVLVVAGGFFVLRVRGLDLTWKLLKQASAILVYSTQTLVGTVFLWHWGILLVIGRHQHSGALYAAAGVGVIGLSVAQQAVGAMLSNDRLKMLRLLGRSAGAATGVEQMPSHLAGCLP